MLQSSFDDEPLPAPRSPTLSRNASASVLQRHLLTCLLENSRRRRFTVDLDSFPVLSFAQIEERYSILDAIGSGLTATVYYGIEKATNREVAVKLMSRRTVSLSPTLMREISILKALKHPSIVELYDVFYDENEDLYLVMELAHGQELFDSLLEKRVYTEDTARAIVRRVLTALAYVHKLGIAHRDLKPENIIIKEASDAPDGFLLKLVDFGFANIVADGMATPLGTLGYKAPELVQGLRYSSSVDMWALGVITYILLCGFPPFFSSPDRRLEESDMLNAPFWTFFNEKTPQLLEEILAARFDFPPVYWDRVSPAAQDFIRRLLQKNPNDRLTASLALRHPWLRTRNLKLPLLHIPKLAEFRVGSQAFAAPLDASDIAPKSGPSLTQSVPSPPLLRVSTSSSSTSSLSSDSIDGSTTLSQSTGEFLLLPVKRYERLRRSPPPRQYSTVAAPSERKQARLAKSQLTLRKSL